jgi:predicted extracellular nuclease
MNGYVAIKIPKFKQEITMKRQGTFLLIAMLVVMVLNFAPSQTQPAAAASDGVVISQVYGGGGNSGGIYTYDFIELLNRGTSPISLSGWSVQYASATGTGAFGATTTQITLLPTVVLQPGQYLLIQEAAGAAVIAPLPTPDVTDSSPIAISGTGGKVALVNSTTSLGCNGGSIPCTSAQLALIIDLVGWDGANFYETAPAPATTNSTAILRNNGGCMETDNNAADFSVGTPTPRNTTNPLHWCGDAAPMVTSTFPANGAANLPLDTDITINFSEPVNVSSASFSLACTTSGGHAFELSGESTTFTLNPEANFTNSEICTLTILAAAVSDQDVDDPYDNMQADYITSFTTLGVCDMPFTPIYQIQGSGLIVAIPGTVTTEGVVVGDFEGTAAMAGFYIQDLTGDGNQATSDGIFVYTGSSYNVSAGQVVRVTGYARERFNQTTLNGSNSNTAVVPLANIIQCGSGGVAPVDVTLPFATSTTPEQYEGMLVRFPQALVISEYFNYDRYGEMVLGLPFDGESRLYTPTAVVEPGPVATALAAQIPLRRITLDDVNSAQNPAVLRHPNGLPFSLDNLFRGGDLVQNAIGVLGYDFSLYRIMPTGSADYTAVNPRPAEPADVGGRMQIAAMNTLNYFLTLDYPTGDPLDNKCGPLLNMECRGADADQADEFTRQRTKLLQALYGLDAAVIGLNEIENTTGVEPLADIVAGLNAIYGYEAYAYIDTGVIGTDAIRVGLIYRPADVTPVGSYQTLDSTDDPRFIDTRNRPTLAQTFEENSTGARFTVAVNHLKSKGSACDGDPDLGDGAGNCNVTRTLAAQALVDWLATDPTGSGDPDFIIMGDMNSYAMEDPIDAIKAGPDDILGTDDDYINLIEKYLGPYAYSYVFDGQVGYLDHALANRPLEAQVTGVTDWHINADESDVLDYDTSFKPASQDALYEPNQYRTSDHDAVIVGLNLTNLPPTVDAGGPYVTSVNASILVNAVGYDPEGTALTYTWDLNNDGIFETPGQSVAFVSAMTGIFPIAVQVTDIGGLTAVDTAVVAVYDPNGLFVNGGGWIDTALGKAEFSFDAKYVKRNPYPVATVSYVIESAGLTFTGSSYDWLVVAGRYSWLHGTGVYNGMAGYTFLLSTEDGNVRLGGNGIDTFRIQIWDASGVLVHDSEPGAAEYAVPTTPLGGGSITVH